MQDGAPGHRGQETAGDCGADCVCQGGCVTGAVPLLGRPGRAWRQAGGVRRVGLHLKVRSMGLHLYQPCSLHTAGRQGRMLVEAAPSSLTGLSIHCMGLACEKDASTPCPMQCGPAPGSHTLSQQGHHSAVPQADPAAGPQSGGVPGSHAGAAIPGYHSGRLDARRGPG